MTKADIAGCRPDPLPRSSGSSLIYKYYGRNTAVRIIGGEPTLRKMPELLSIVRGVRELGMRPTLMSNGRRATRPM